MYKSLFLDILINLCDMLKLRTIFKHEQKGFYLFLVDDTENKSFKNYLINECILDTLDSRFKIIKKEINKNISLYYIKKDVRIFVKSFDNDDKIKLHAGFECKIIEDGKTIWKTGTVTDDLSTKEILKLFGTIKFIVKKMNFTSLYVAPEIQKYNVFRRMMLKLANELKY